SNDEGSLTRQHLISLYLDIGGRNHPDAAEALLDLDPLKVQAARSVAPLPELGPLHTRLEELAQVRGRERFLAEQLAHNERLDRRRTILERSYHIQERALEAIG